MTDGSERADPTNEQRFNNEERPPKLRPAPTSPPCRVATRPVRAYARHTRSLISEGLSGDASRPAHPVIATTGASSTVPPVEPTWPGVMVDGVPRARPSRLCMSQVSVSYLVSTGTKRSAITLLGQPRSPGKSVNGIGV